MAEFKRIARFEKVSLTVFLESFKEDNANEIYDTIKLQIGRAHV